MEGALQRVPAIADVGVQSTVCGPESFTPDHKPLLGEVRASCPLCLCMAFVCPCVVWCGGWVYWCVCVCVCAMIMSRAARAGHCRCGRAEHSVRAQSPSPQTTSPCWARCVHLVAPFPPLGGLPSPPCSRLICQHFRRSNEGNRARHSDWRRTRSAALETLG